MAFENIENHILPPGTDEQWMRQREIAIQDLESIKDNYIEGYGYEAHPIDTYYAIEYAIQYMETAVSNVLNDVKKEISQQFVNLQDGSEEWREYVNDTVLESLEILDKHIKKYTLDEQTKTANYDQADIDR